VVEPKRPVEAGFAALPNNPPVVLVEPKPEVCAGCAAPNGELVEPPPNKPPLPVVVLPNPVDGVVVAPKPPPKLDEPNAPACPFALPNFRPCV